jgi:hypothetical protein
MELNNLEDLIRKATLEILGIPDNKANGGRVRIAWGQTGAPAWKIADNIAFIRVYQVDGQYNRLKDVQYQNNNITSLKRTESYTRIIAVDWILYGPSGFDDADIIRNGLNKNETLTKNNLFLVYDRPAPTRTPELFNGQWWERSNLTAYFYEQISREYTMPIIAGASVTVKTEGGDIFNGNITP